MTSFGESRVSRATNVSVRVEGGTTNAVISLGARDFSRSLRSSVCWIRRVDSNVRSVSSIGDDTELTRRTRGASGRSNAGRERTKFTLVFSVDFSRARVTSCALNRHHGGSSSSTNYGSSGFVGAVVSRSTCDGGDNTSSRTASETSIARKAVS